MSEVDEELKDEDCIQMIEVECTASVDGGLRVISVYLL